MLRLGAYASVGSSSKIRQNLPAHQPVKPTDPRFRWLCEVLWNHREKLENEREYAKVPVEMRRSFGPGVDEFRGVGWIPGTDKTT
jgi:hypothetical protein